MLQFCTIFITQWGYTTNCENNTHNLDQLSSFSALGLVIYKRLIHTNLYLWLLQWSQLIYQYYHYKHLAEPGILICSGLFER